MSQKPKALIYCRVSSERQVKEGHGLESQEKRCRDWAIANGYKVEEVFGDKGVSGGLFDREAMQALLAYIDAHPGVEYLVIFDDLSRFARDVAVHLQLKLEFLKRKAKLFCLTLQLEDTPVGRMVETVIASTSQLFREQNTETVKNKMRARLESGYWPFRAFPTGYKREIIKGHGKLAVPDGLIAQAISRLFQAILDHLIWTQEDARRFLEDTYKSYGLIKPVSGNGIKRILSNRFYIGIIDYLPWGIEGVEGKHQPITSSESFQADQDLLANRMHARRRKDYNADFPLRPLVVCFLCEEPLTGSWNTGRTQRYANYRCKNEDCPFRNVSLPKEVVEPRFEEFLSQVKPIKQILALTQRVLVDVWDDMESRNRARIREIDNDVDQLDRQISSLVEKVSRANNPVLEKVYEGQIELFSSQKEKLQNGRIELEKAFTKEDFGIATNKVLSYVAEPVKMWKSGSYYDQKTLLEMYFEKGPKYDPEFGFGTANLTCLPKLLQVKAGDQKSLVELEGIEPSSENRRTKSSTSVGCLISYPMRLKQSKHELEQH